MIHILLSSDACHLQGFWAAVCPFNFTAIGAHLPMAPALVVSIFCFIKKFMQFWILMILTYFHYGDHFKHFGWIRVSILRCENKAVPTGMVLVLHNCFLIYLVVSASQWWIYRHTSLTCRQVNDVCLYTHHWLCSNFCCVFVTDCRNHEEFYLYQWICSACYLNSFGFWNRVSEQQKNKKTKQNNNLFYDWTGLFAVFFVFKLSENWLRETGHVGES